MDIHKVLFPSNIVYALCISTASLITHHHQRPKGEPDVSGIIEELLAYDYFSTSMLSWDSAMFSLCLLLMLHSIEKNPVFPLISLFTHGPQWIAEPLWLWLSLLSENRFSRSDFLQWSRQSWVCLWWYTTAMPPNWERSVRGLLRVTSLHRFSPSGCILVLSSRQMCSCAHSVTWGQLYYFHLCTGKDQSG